MKFLISQLYVLLIIINAVGADSNLPGNLRMVLSTDVKASAELRRLAPKKSGNPRPKANAPKHQQGAPAGGAPGNGPPAGVAQPKQQPSGGAPGNGPPAGVAQPKQQPAGGAQVNGPPAGVAQPKRQPAGVAQAWRPPAGVTQARRPQAGGVQVNGPPAGVAQARRPPAGVTQARRPPAGVTQARRPPAGGTQAKKHPPKGEMPYGPFYKNERYDKPEIIDEPINDYKLRYPGNRPAAGRLREAYKLPTAAPRASFYVAPTAQPRSTDPPPNTPPPGILAAPKGGGPGTKKGGLRPGNWYPEDGFGRPEVEDGANVNKPWMRSNRSSSSSRSTVKSMSNSSLFEGDSDEQERERGEWDKERKETQKEMDGEVEYDHLGRKKERLRKNPLASEVSRHVVHPSTEAPPPTRPPEHPDKHMEAWEAMEDKKPDGVGRVGRGYFPGGVAPDGREIAPISQVLGIGEGSQLPYHGDTPVLPLMGGEGGFTDRRGISPRPQGYHWGTTNRNRDELELAQARDRNEHVGPPVEHLYPSPDPPNLGPVEALPQYKKFKPYSGPTTAFPPAQPKAVVKANGRNRVHFEDGQGPAERVDFPKIPPNLLPRYTPLEIPRFPHVPMTPNLQMRMPPNLNTQFPMTPMTPNLNPMTPNLHQLTPMGHMQMPPPQMPMGHMQMPPPQMPMGQDLLPPMQMPPNLHMQPNLNAHMQMPPNLHMPMGPNQQMPYQQMPNQQMPFQQMPYQQMPYQQMPYQQMPFQQMPYQQMPYQQMPYQQMPFQQMPFQQMPHPQMRQAGLGRMGLRRARAPPVKANLAPQRNGLRVTDNNKRPPLRAKAVPRPPPTDEQIARMQLRAKAVPRPPPTDEQIARSQLRAKAVPKKVQDGGDPKAER